MALGAPRPLAGIFRRGHRGERCRALQAPWIQGDEAARVKTKAYKLATDLGVPEQTVLDWLRVNGYPTVRRGDTIRAEVVQAAHRALAGDRRAAELARAGRPMAPEVPRPRDSQIIEPPRPRESQIIEPPRPRPSQAIEPPRTQPVGRTTPERTPPERTTGAQRTARTTDGFRVSFAALLEEHLPQGLSDAVAAVPAGPAMVPPPRTTGPLPRPTPRASGGLSQEEVLKLRLARIETDRDQARRELEILQQRLEADQVRLGQAREALAQVQAEREALAVLRQEHDRLLLERATLRQTLQAALDERGTLEQTCAELQLEVAEVRESLSAADAERDGREAMIGELESTMQREVAWRARALELERAVQLGNSLPALLQGFGLEDLRLQAEVLRALLAERDSALAVLKAIRQVDAAVLSKLISGRVVRVCSHPICDEVARADDQVRVRVDDAARCEICQDSADRRWFARLVRECNRSGARRLLVIGGNEATQRILRDLSQGQPVDLRLVPDTESAPVARVRGRVESCDVLVLWSPSLVPAEISLPYAQAAEAEGRPVVQVLGERFVVADMARAVSIRLARNHILVAT